MSRMKSFKTNEDLTNKIISVAYGDARIIDKLLVRRLSKKHIGVRKLLEDYKSIAKEVHKIKEEECPDSLLNNIPVKTTLKRKSFAADLYLIIFYKPLASTMMSLILIGAIVWGVLSNKKIQYRHTYTNTEIQLAERQTKLAFAIVGKIFDETSNTLTNEVLKSQVAKPFNVGIGMATDLINKGEIQ